MTKPATYVQRIHFEDFDGSQFERLVFAYHWRTDDWRSREWSQGHIADEIISDWLKDV